MNNKRVLVTGCCGTVGQELVRQILRSTEDSLELIGIDNNESELFFIDQNYITDPRASFYLADMRDFEALDSLFNDIDVVFLSLIHI